MLDVAILEPLSTNFHTLLLLYSRFLEFLIFTFLKGRESSRRFFLTKKFNLCAISRTTFAKTSTPKKTANNL